MAVATVDRLLGGFAASPYSLTLDPPLGLRGPVGILATLRDPYPGRLRRLTETFLAKKFPRLPMSSVDLDRPGALRLVSEPLVVRRTPREVGGRRGEIIASMVLDPEVTDALCDRPTPRAFRGGRSLLLLSPKVERSRR